MIKKMKIWNGEYLIVKSKKTYDDAFANIIDKKEITVIIQEKGFDEKDAIKIEKGYKLITFEMILPFSMVGFIAKVSSSLAKEKIPIFVISAFSTDHLLIKKQYLNKTIKCLEKLGFRIE